MESEKKMIEQSEYVTIWHEAPGISILTNELEYFQELFGIGYGDDDDFYGDFNKLE